MSNGEHTHGADDKTAKASFVVADMKHQAETSHVNNRNTIRDAVGQQDDSVLAALTSTATLSRRFQRAQAKEPIQIPRYQ